MPQQWNWQLGQIQPVNNDAEVQARLAGGRAFDPVFEAAKQMMQEKGANARAEYDATQQRIRQQDTIAAQERIQGMEQSGSMARTQAEIEGRMRIENARLLQERQAGSVLAGAYGMLAGGGQQQQYDAPGTMVGAPMQGPTSEGFLSADQAGALGASGVNMLHDDVRQSAEDQRKRSQERALQQGLGDEAQHIYGMSDRADQDRLPEVMSLLRGGKYDDAIKAIGEVRGRNIDRDERSMAVKDWEKRAGDALKSGRMDESQLRSMRAALKNGPKDRGAWDTLYKDVTERVGGIDTASVAADRDAKKSERTDFITGKEIPESAIKGMRAQRDSGGTWKVVNERGGVDANTSKSDATFEVMARLAELRRMGADRSMNFGGDPGGADAAAIFQASSGLDPAKVNEWKGLLLSQHLGAPPPPAQAPQDPGAGGGEGGPPPWVQALPPERLNAMLTEMQAVPQGVADRAARLAAIEAKYAPQQQSQAPASSNPVAPGLSYQQFFDAGKSPLNQNTGPQFAPKPK